MLAFVAYFICIASLIAYNVFFGLLRDMFITKRQLLAVFLLKCAAIPVFIHLYGNAFGGLEKSDAGKFYHDATVLRSCAQSDPGLYLRALCGMQDDRYGSDEHTRCYSKTYNWNEGRERAFLFSSNRLVIRIHSVLDFAVRGYYAHALFSCFFSFIGLFLFYKAFAAFIRRHHFAFFLAIALWPSLWLYTAAPMKEAIGVLLLGLAVRFSFMLFYAGITPRRMVFLAVTAAGCIFIRPFVLLPVLSLLLAALFIDSLKLRRGGLIFTAVAVAGVLTLLQVQVSGTSTAGAIQAQRRTFLVSAAGGIYLSNDTRVIRLPYDTSAIRRSSRCDSCYTIRRHASYAYWDDARPMDSLYCADNADTVTVYAMDDISPPGNSNLPFSYGQSVVSQVAASLYAALFYPLFAGARSTSQWLASAENLVIIIVLLMCVFRFRRFPRGTCVPVFLVLTVLMISILIGYTSPNTGAIVRYRALLMPLLLATAVWTFPYFGEPEGSRNSSYIR